MLAVWVPIYFELPSKITLESNIQVIITEIACHQGNHTGRSHTMQHVRSDYFSLKEILYNGSFLQHVFVFFECKNNPPHPQQ